MFSNSSISRNPDLIAPQRRSDEGIANLPRQIADVRIPSKFSADDEMYGDQNGYSIPSQLNNYGDNSLPPDLNAQIDRIVNKKVEKKME